MPNPQSKIINYAIKNLMDLISLILTLKPLNPEPDRELPAWWGRAAHAMLLDIIRQYDAQMADSLHAQPASQDLHNTIQNPQSKSQNSPPVPSPPLP
jgi:hypothetical protein